MASEFGGHASKVFLGGFDWNYVLGVFLPKGLVVDVSAQKDLRCCIVQYFSPHIFWVFLCEGKEIQSQQGMDAKVPVES